MLLLSITILILCIYIFVKKQQNKNSKENFVSPLYNDTGLPDYENTEYSPLGM